MEKSQTTVRPETSSQPYEPTFVTVRLKHFYAVGFMSLSFFDITPLDQLASNRLEVVEK